MAHLKTLSDLRTATRDRLDESTATFWTNAQLNRYINRAKDRVWSRIRSLNEDYFMVRRTSLDGSVTILGETYATTSFQIVATTVLYTLPPDFSEMKLIVVTTDGYEDVRFEYKDLTHPEMRAALEITDDQTPATFFFDIVGERTMRIAPPSNTTLDIEINYVQALGEMTTDADTMTMPHPLYLAVESYAVALALEQDRNPDSKLVAADGDKIIAEVIGATHRQTQNPEHATAYLAEWTGWS